PRQSPPGAPGQEQALSMPVAAPRGLRLRRSYVWYCPRDPRKIRLDDPGPRTAPSASRYVLRPGDRSGCCGMVFNRACPAASTANPDRGSGTDPGRRELPRRRGAAAGSAAEERQDCRRLAGELLARDDRRTESRRASVENHERGVEHRPIGAANGRVEGIDVPNDQHHTIAASGEGGEVLLREAALLDRRAVEVRTVRVRMPG